MKICILTRGPMQLTYALKQGWWLRRAFKYKSTRWWR